MKNSLIILAFVLVGVLPLNATNYRWDNSTSFSINATTTIDDGWYAATVKYLNYSTGTNSTYSLNVYVQYDRVTKIDFGNGGSVHNGYNNEGYLYTGGTLYFDTDYNGTITSATANVTISESNGSMHTYKIIIE